LKPPPSSSKWWMADPILQSIDSPRASQYECDKSTHPGRGEQPTGLDLPRGVKFRSEAQGLFAANGSSRRGIPTTTESFCRDMFLHGCDKDTPTTIPYRLLFLSVRRRLAAPLHSSALDRQAPLQGRPVYGDGRGLPTSRP
jgi:hypothetical protein